MTTPHTQRSSPRRWLTRIALGAVVGLAALPLACGDDSALPGVSSGGAGGTNGCTDSDQDGYGDGCLLGSDCDDADPSVTHQCYACDKPRPGCPCDDEGARVSCGQVESRVGDQVTCGYGETICTNGEWSECIINNSVTLLPGGDPKQQPQALGQPATCAANPCDPYCKQWPDTPDGLPDGGGIVVTEAGIGLPLGDAGPPPPSACSGGTSGSCAHHVCETGGALAAGCDAVAGAQCVPQGGACGGSPCCYGLTCVGGTCQAAAVPGVIWQDSFDSGNNGWTLGTEWQIGPATASGGHNYGYADPASDTTATADDNVLGVRIGNNATTALHGYYYATSPTIDTSAAVGSMTLEYRRWLNSDYPPWMNNQVQISTNNGSTWTTIWTGDTIENAWQTITHDITAYKSAQMRIRFGHTVGQSGAYVVSSWNLDDIRVKAQIGGSCVAEGASCAAGQACCTSPTCTNGVCTTPAATSCVAQVCATMPSCCTTAWTGACVNALATACPSSSCAITNTGTCVFCYADALDHDGDGWSFANGDCKDCDPLVNPGAYDFTGNGLDDDCSGVIDDEPTGCDVGLPFSTDVGLNYAKAMDLCRTTTAGASGAAKTWGVIAGSMVQANGSTACSNGLQRAITSQWGTNNFPQQGTRMAVVSSGTARDTNDPGYVNPSGQYASYNAGTNVPPPAGFPKNAAGCPNGSAANDSCGLRMQIRAPTNALSFSYNFDFFSSEYSEWICTAYNDTFIALYYGALNPFADKNISFDSNNNPVSVNVGFFGIPTNPSLTTHPHLDGTGYAGYCGNYGQSPNGMCGGATGWLTTTAPVNPGEVITLHYSIWDTGDHVWDSTVLLDNFLWSPQTSNISTQPAVPPPPPPTYSEGNFIRDYDALEACPAGTKFVWGHWSWTSTTPNDSSIEYYVSTATTQAGLASAPEDKLQFSNPPGPAALAGSHAIAKIAPVDTQNGAAVVDKTLQNMNRPRNLQFVRIRSRLVPSSDQLSAPTLHAWNLEVSCQPNE